MTPEMARANSIRLVNLENRVAGELTSAEIMEIIELRHWMDTLIAERMNGAQVAVYEYTEGKRQ